MFGNTMMHHVRKISQTPVKVYGWVSCGATSMSRFWGPSSVNKERDLHALIDSEVKRTGKSAIDVAAEVFVLSKCHSEAFLKFVQILFSIRGRVLEAPGVPPMYDYEHFPQAVGSA